MNDKRRERIQKLADQVEGIKDEILEIHEEEQEAYDNMPENLQDGDKGEAAMTACDATENAADDLANALVNLQEAIEA